MSLSIVGINLGTIENLYRTEIIWNAHGDTEVTHIPTPCWYIKGGKKKIIVDTGFMSVEWFNTHVTRGPGATWQVGKRRPDEELPQALAGAGVKPEEIDIVINTHLHFDHCGQNYMFKNAEFIVQRDNYKDAFMPFSGQEWAYANQIAFPNEMPPFWGTNFTFVDGDFEIADGVRCITLPGHAVGLQGVVVDTAKGRYIVAGDHVVTIENWEKQIPNGYFSSVCDWYKSSQKIKALGATPIACHEKKYFEKEKYPTFG